VKRRPPVRVDQVWQSKSDTDRKVEVAAVIGARFVLLRNAATGRQVRATVHTLTTRYTLVLDSVIHRHQWTGPEPETAVNTLLGGDPGAHRHSHRIPGVWDDDNGAAAGKVCHGCWIGGYAVSRRHVEGRA
jgi:hypothetical protein